MNTLYTTLLIFFISVNAFSHGEVLYVRNKVYVGKDQLKKGDAISVGMIVNTGKDSLAIIRFNNSSTIKVNENSSVTLKNYDQAKKSSRFSLSKGSGFFKMDPKAGGKLSVRAKHVAMGVRGTHFFVSFGSKKKEDVYMCVQEGKVAIKGKDQRKAILVKAGQGVVVVDGLQSSKPNFLPWTKNLNWELNPNKKKDLINNVSIEESYSDPLERDYD